MIILNVFWGVHLQTGDSEKKKSSGKLILHSRDFYISLMIFAGGRAHSPDVALSNRLTSLFKNVSHPVAVEPRSDVAFLVEISEAEVR